MKYFVMILGILALLLSNVWSFNRGVDYGLDVGICVSTVQLADIHPADIGFCERADEAETESTVREYYLKSQNRHIDQN